MVHRSKVRCSSAVRADGSGESCRLPKTPRTPRSVAKHYFDEHINTPSEYGDESAYSAYSTYSDREFPEPDEL